MQVPFVGTLDFKVGRPMGGLGNVLGPSDSQIH